MVNSSERWLFPTSADQCGQNTAYAYREELQKELSEMLKAGIVEESQSEWSSPIVLVWKKDKALHLCICWEL